MDGSDTWNATGAEPASTTNRLNSDGNNRMGITMVPQIRESSTLPYEVMSADPQHNNQAPSLGRTQGGSSYTSTRRKFA